MGVACSAKPLNRRQLSTGGWAMIHAPPDSWPQSKAMQTLHSLKGARPPKHPPLAPPWRPALTAAAAARRQAPWAYRLLLWRHAWPWRVSAARPRRRCCHWTWCSQRRRPLRRDAWCLQEAR